MGKEMLCGEKRTSNEKEFRQMKKAYEKEIEKK